MLIYLFTEDIVHARADSYGMIEYRIPTELRGQRRTWMLQDVSGVVSRGSLGHIRLSHPLPSLPVCVYFSHCLRRPISFSPPYAVGQAFHFFHFLANSITLSLRRHSFSHWLASSIGEIHDPLLTLLKAGFYHRSLLPRPLVPTFITARPCSPRTISSLPFDYLSFPPDSLRRHLSRD